MESENVFNQK